MTDCPGGTLHPARRRGGHRCWHHAYRSRRRPAVDHPRHHPAESLRDHDVPGRAGVLCAEIRTAGLLAPETLLDLALASHHAVRSDTPGSAAAAELLEQPGGGDYTYYADLAAFMTGRTTPPGSARWIEDEQIVRERWQQLVTARRALVQT